MEADLNIKVAGNREQETRPTTTVILAMSADGKIADASRTAARFGSAQDKAHLERQVALVDGVLLGAGTLRAYGTTLRVVRPELLEQRQQQGKPLQPVQIVCSRSAALDPQLPFFRQPVPRWLLTTPAGARLWQESEAFERLLVTETPIETIDWQAAFGQLWGSGLKTLAVLGGGALVASLLEANLLDELWLTVCPLLLGGVAAPTPVDGKGIMAALAPRLQLLEVKTIDDEVFLHYRVKKV
ncbi:RibD family protein [Leptolyngbya sp. FACHB-321]|uniref:RibD family protein n=1 Tax=Leptolyngbya sp. FACHB-321 TaxID=2692807 RepID=UPI001F54EB88|nr:RibD family protein [Leptolyngbya sp. FACHB-321]